MSRFANPSLRKTRTKNFGLIGRSFCAELAPGFIYTSNKSATFLTAWCLSEFSYENETVMLAPASGFYSDPSCGRNEVRIAYVLKKEDLERALFILRKALEAYNAR